MPSSNYLGFAVTYESSPGVLDSVGLGVDVIIYDSVAMSDIATVTTDASGTIAAGTAPTAPGRRVFFRVENFLGRAFSTSQITT